MKLPLNLLFYLFAFAAVWVSAEGRGLSKEKKNKLRNGARKIRNAIVGAASDAASDVVNAAANVAVDVATNVAANVAANVATGVAANVAANVATDVAANVATDVAVNDPFGDIATNYVYGDVVGDGIDVHGDVESSILPDDEKSSANITSSIFQIGYGLMIVVLLILAIYDLFCEKGDKIRGVCTMMICAISLVVLHNNHDFYTFLDALRNHGDSGGSSEDAVHVVRDSVYQVVGLYEKMVADARIFAEYSKSITNSTSFLFQIGCGLLVVLLVVLSISDLFREKDDKVRGGLTITAVMNLNF